MNKCFLIGNLTRDPETSTTQNGITFTRMSIAVNRTFANAAGERVTDFFDIVAWRALAETCAKYLFKGSKIAVSGSIQRRNYEDSNGVKRVSFDIVAEDVEFLTPKGGAGGSGFSRQDSDSSKSHVGDLEPVDDDELPF